MSEFTELKTYYDGMIRGYSVRKKEGAFPFTASEAAEIARRANSYDALLKACEAVEWVWVSGNTVKECPWCGGSELFGHTPTCIRTIAIALAEKS